MSTRPPYECYRIAAPGHRLDGRVVIVTDRLLDQVCLAELRRGRVAYGNWHHRTLLDRAEALPPRPRDNPLFGLADVTLNHRGTPGTRRGGCGGSGRAR